MAASFPMRGIVRYKVEFQTVHGTGNGVLYATSGKLRGGNSGVAFKAILTRIFD